MLIINNINVFVLVLLRRGGVHAFRAVVTNNTHVITEVMSMEILIYSLHAILKIACLLGVKWVPVSAV